MDAIGLQGIWPSFPVVIIVLTTGVYCFQVDGTVTIVSGC